MASKTLKCEGVCSSFVNGCRGEVKRVRVRDKGDTFPYKDWGYFNYCDEAIAEDRRRGFTVTVPKEKKIDR